MRVAVTGSSGYLGRKLARRLAGDPAVEALLGLDLQPANGPTGLEFRELDVRDAALADRLAEFGADVLVHLAWVFNPTHRRRWAWEVDVLGSRNAFRAAALAGVGRVVYPSSTTTYGAHPDLPQPIPETAPIRGRADFAYSSHKVEVERFLDEFEPAHPEVRVTRLRGAIVMGAGMRNFITRLLELPGPLRALPREGTGRVNFCHEEDMSEVLALATLEARPGTFNVAAPDALTVEEAARLCGRPFYKLPFALLWAMVSLLWELRLFPTPPAYLHFVRHSWVADVSRLQRDFGYWPRRSSRDALRELAQARGWKR